MSELYEAIVNDDTELARKLIENGADVNATCDGQTPLYAALAHGSIELYECLREKNAKIDLISNLQSPLDMTEIDLMLHIQTPLDVAIHHNQTEMIKYLINEDDGNVNYPFDGLKIPLNIAIDDGNLEMVKFLVNIGADVNNVCPEWHNKEPPLIHAVINGNIEIIKYLIEKGANLEAIPKYKDKIQEIYSIDPKIWHYIENKIAK